MRLSLCVYLFLIYLIDIKGNNYSSFNNGLLHMSKHKLFV